MGESLFLVPNEVLFATLSAGGPSVSTDAQTLSIRLAKQLNRATATGSPLAIVRWASATEDVGPLIPLGVLETVLIESPGERGQMRWTESVQPLNFTSEPPEGATALKIALPDGTVVKVSRDKLRIYARKLPDPHIELVGPADARFVIPVFSERFEDRDSFVGKVKRLHDWILTQPPFCRPEVGKHFALRAHFWKSDPENGLFGTRDDRIVDDRLFHGDRAIAKAQLAPFIGSAEVSLILINSSARGGAGGQPGYSAWSSITAEPGEAWEAVCLHEIGHSFGLADEYLDANRARDRFEGREPNVASDPRPSRTSWCTLVTLPETPSPSLLLGAEYTGPVDGVGTFQGARYRKDLYRPAHSCLMNVTNTHFCPVCQAHIAKEI